MRMGFVGLGRMGLHMAANCAAAGIDLVVWNRSKAPVDTLLQRSAVRAVSSPSELAASTDVVVSMLANDAAVRAVYLGERGLIAIAGATTLVEMGTISPALVAELAQAASQHGKRFVDAPVSGATAAARDAQLLIMAGAPHTQNDPLELVFQAIGRRTIWLGASGKGAVMKLAVNLLIHGLNQGLSEALSLAVRSGIDPSAAFDVIENSAAAAPMLHYRRPLYLDEHANEVTFTVNLAAKDVGFALGLAQQQGLELPQASSTLAVLHEAIEAQYGERDMASIYNFTQEKNT